MVNSKFLFIICYIVTAILIYKYVKWKLFNRFTTRESRFRFHLDLEQKVFSLLKHYSTFHLSDTRASSTFRHFPYFLDDMHKTNYSLKTVTSGPH